MNIVNIDGVSTRKKISELTGKKFGVCDICTSHGLDPTALNKACLRGYATINQIQPYLKKDIPIIFSNEPIPCRVLNRPSKQMDISEINTEKEKESQSYADAISRILINHFNAIAKEIAEIIDKGE